MRASVASLLAAVSLALLVAATARADAPLSISSFATAASSTARGSPWYLGDIAVRNETIVRIAPRIEAPATRTIDAAGKVVAPGFIDIHTHSRRGIFQVPTRRKLHPPGRDDAD
jgi:imidazolonepropionase-like amidohydrolase